MFQKLLLPFRLRLLSGREIVGVGIEQAQQPHGVRVGAEPVPEVAIGLPGILVNPHSAFSVTLWQS